MAKILIKVLGDTVKNIPEWTKIKRDKLMKCFRTFHEPKMSSNILLIDFLEKKRENNCKEIIF